METLGSPRGRSILAVLCLSLLMVVVGNTVLNVAIPTLVNELDATSSQLQWMVDSYGLVFAGLLLTCGALGDRFGRKGALTVGLLIFGGASAISAIATSADQLIATRAVMGLGAALVMPATLSILTNVFVPQQRAAAIAIWAGVAGAGGAIGPIAGGWLLEHFFWGSVFLLNVPIVLTALVAGHFLLPTSSDPTHAPLDFAGPGSRRSDSELCSTGSSRRPTTAGPAKRPSSLRDRGRTLGPVRAGGNCAHRIRCSTSGSSATPGSVRGPSPSR